ncbi:MAG TPA: acetate--CoA ligase family protein, partial [Candidatus Tectomicrobia bacterium]|nr:acetate--CoA ligase family protein [Candidatus Tectomicrobia bacterium]
PPARATPPGAGQTAALRAHRTRRTIHEHDAKRLLAQAGLPVVREQLVASLDEAQGAARGIGYPVALKVVSDAIPHRSDLGLVAVGLRDDRDLACAWTRISRRLQDLGPRAEAAGWLVQEMADGVLEVFSGVSRDPDFGPVLAVGTGGILVDALGDVALRPLPLRAGDAEAMIGETRAGALLRGFRGRPPGDVAALARCLEMLADFAWAERASLAELDVNPIVVRAAGAGCVVADALIVPQPGA